MAYLGSLLWGWNKILSPTCIFVLKETQQPGINVALLTNNEDEEPALLFVAMLSRSI
jgi:hypothetical protein